MMIACNWMFASTLIQKGQVSEDFSQQDWDNFQKVYSSVEDIDLFVGGLAEVGSGDGLVGPTFGCIIGKQFELLMKGVFWHS